MPRLGTTCLLQHHRCKAHPRTTESFLLRCMLLFFGFFYFRDGNNDHVVGFPISTGRGSCMLGQGMDEVWEQLCLGMHEPCPRPPFQVDSGVVHHPALCSHSSDEPTFSGASIWAASVKTPVIVWCTNSDVLSQSPRCGFCT